MSRVVIDANVYVSALIRPQDPPVQILERLLAEGPHTIIVSKMILEEVRRSLDYPKVRRKIDATDKELDAWVDFTRRPRRRRERCARSPSRGIGAGR